MDRNQVDETTPRELVDRILIRDLVFGNKSLLNERERVVLFYTFFRGETLKEAGSRLSISACYAGLVRSKALKRIWLYLRSVDESFKNQFSIYVEECVKDDLRMIAFLNEKKKRERTEKKELVAEKEGLAAERKRIREERAAVEKKRIKKKEETESGLVCPDCIVLYGAEGGHYLAVHLIRLGSFIPITKKTYDRWLKEKIDMEL